MPISPAELFERFHLAVYRYLLRMTGRRDVAEDLTQDVFVRALQHRHVLDLHEGARAGAPRSIAGLTSPSKSAEVCGDA